MMRARCALDSRKRRSGAGVSVARCQADGSEREKAGKLSESGMPVDESSPENVSNGGEALAQIGGSDIINQRVHRKKLLSIREAGMKPIGKEIKGSIFTISSAYIKPPW